MQGKLSALRDTYTLLSSRPSSWSDRASIAMLRPVSFFLAVAVSLEASGPPLLCLMLRSYTQGRAAQKARPLTAVEIHIQRSHTCISEAASSARRCALSKLASQSSVSCLSPTPLRQSHKQGTDRATSAAVAVSFCDSDGRPPEGMWASKQKLRL